MAGAKSILIVGLVGYAALGALMYVAQRALMYFPDTARTPPAMVGLRQAEEIALATADGERVIAWHLAPRDGGPVVLYFHGNGGSLASRAGRFAALTADGTGLVALSYRGYGGSSGRPTEEGLIRDAEAVHAFAVARYPATRLIPWGESLGSGVAVALAAAHPVGGVILESPFSSAVDVAAAVYWFLPVRLMMKDTFRSDLRIGRVTAPVLVLHGGEDAVVPIRFGERLYAAVTAPKRFVRFPAGGHDDLDAHGALAAVRAFLAER